MNSSWKAFIGGILVMALLFVAYLNFSSAWESKKTILISEGQQQGYEAAIYSIMVQAAQCKEPVPLIFGNATLNLIAVECLQKPTEEPLT